MHVKYIKKDVIAYRMINIANGTQISKFANQFHVRTYKVRNHATEEIVNLVMSVLQNVNTIIISNFAQKINAIGIPILRNVLSVILISATILLVLMINVAIIKKLLSLGSHILFVFQNAKK